MGTLIVSFATTASTPTGSFVV